MGYELNQLMKRYGLSTATISPYSGMGAPTALAADATADQRNQFVTDSGNYMAQKAAYDQYKNDYQNRIASTSAYQDSPLFKGEKKSWDAPLKTPNYSLASPKTNADYDPLIKQAYSTIGRFDMGDKIANIDQPTYDDMMFQLKTGNVSTGDFGTYFTKRANDWMAQNPNTDLTKYVKGYQNPKDIDPNELNRLGQIKIGAPAATPAVATTVTPAVTPTVTPTPTEEEDPYVGAFPSSTGDWRDSARGGHIKYAHGGPVRHFYGGGQNKIDGGINDLVDKYDLANPAELPVMMAKNDTGTMTDAVPSAPVSSAVRAGEPPMQRGPVPQGESAPQMTTPSPAGGATLGAAPAPAAAPSGQTPLEVLHQKYLNAGRQSKSAEMTAAEQKYASKNDALINLLKEQANKTEDNAPSKAEMYFRLAAALAAPTKTGAFTENMGLAAKELADFQKSTTDAKKAAAAAKLQLLLKTGEIDAQQAKEELANLKEGEKEGRDVARTFAMKEYEVEAKKNEPQSALAKEVMERTGLKPGTPGFQAEMTRINKLKETKDAQAVEKTGLEIKKAAKAGNELSRDEWKASEELDKSITDGTQALADLKEAFVRNNNSYDASTLGTFKRRALELANSQDEKLLNTQAVERLMGTETLSRLKSTFGGQPSNAEGKLLKEYSGLAAQNTTARKEALARAIMITEDRLAKNQAKLKNVLEGRMKTIVDTGSGKGQD